MLPLALVRRLRTRCAVEMYFNSTSLALTSSLSQWYLTSKCLVRSARHGFVAILMVFTCYLEGSCVCGGEGVLPRALRAGQASGLDRHLFRPVRFSMSMLTSIFDFDLRFLFYIYDYDFNFTITI